MADQEDYYKILGVDKSASQDDITHAYRELAKKWHPDVNHSPDATAMFEKITKAYEVLKDPQKRAAYDQFGNGAFDENGNAGFNPNNFNGFNGGAGGAGGFSADDLGDIFSQFFGGGAGRTRRSSRKASGPVTGANSYMRMKISFMDAIKGRIVNMPYRYDAVCDMCHGKGAVNPSDVIVCPTCNGSGVVVTTQRTMFGVFQNQTTCPDCGGAGTKIVNPCAKCHGQGYVTTNTTLNISIPAGIDQGQQLRVPGKGERGSNGGPNGDLFIEIVIDKDKTFTRDGNDITVTVKVPLITAILGGTVTVPTVYGDYELEIKNGTQPGAVVKIKGQGVKGLNGVTGDELVNVVIAIPTRLNAEEKKLYAELGEISAKKGESKNFFQKFFKKK